MRLIFSAFSAKSGERHSVKKECRVLERDLTVPDSHIINLPFGRFIIWVSA